MNILWNITLNVVLCWRGTDITITCLNVNMRTGCREEGWEWWRSLCRVLCVPYQILWKLSHQKGHGALNRILIIWYLKWGNLPSLAHVTNKLFQLTSRRRVGEIEVECHSFLTSTPDGGVRRASCGWSSSPGEGQHDAMVARLSGPLRPSEIFLE